MSTTLRDPTARLLDLPLQSLGPLPLRESPGDPRGGFVNVFTDRGRGRFPRNRRLRPHPL
jgi:hypothetical protein